MELGVVVITYLSSTWLACKLIGASGELSSFIDLEVVLKVSYTADYLYCRQVASLLRAQHASDDVELVPDDNLEFQDSDSQDSDSGLEDVL